MAELLPIEFFAVRRGSANRSFDVTPFLADATWTTNAIGGFGSLSLTLPGGTARWRRELPKLAIIRATYGSIVVWEGQVEDHALSISKDSLTTTVQCFGFSRILTEKSVRRIWSKRDLRFVPGTTPNGGISPGGSVARNSGNFSVQAGAFDPTDLTKAGVQVTGIGAAVGNTGGEWSEYRLPSGLTIVSFNATMVLSGANTGAAKMNSFWETFDATGTRTAVASFVASSALAVVAAANTVGFRFGFFNNSGGAAVTPLSSDLAQFSAIRLLGTSLTEDVSGGFYGGPILRDLIALCPGLTIGTIEDGSDFAIQAIERSVRDNALSVVNEVAGYYAAREWAVWDSQTLGVGRFDWKTANFDGADVLLDVAQCTALDLTDSIDPTEQTSYVLYSDAASGFDAEASTASTKRTNPYVKNGRAKDVMTSVSFPMTANTSAQLSAAINQNRGARPIVSGTVTLPGSALLGGRRPMIAAAVRAGMNVQILGLPKDEPFVQGRDGQTLFHIVSTSASLTGDVTLTLDSQTRTIDVLLARLSAATRVLTG